MRKTIGLLGILSVLLSSASASAAPAAAPAALVLPVAQPANPVLLDGAGLDPVWSRAVTLPPLVLRTGAAPSVASRVQAVRCGPWLLFAIDAVEPGTIVARETQAGSVLWSEDGFVVELGAASNRVDVIVNPLGAVEVALNGKPNLAPVTAGRLLRAARVTPGAWRAEVAVDAGLVLGEAAGPVDVRVKRQRMPRQIDFDEEAYYPPAASPAARLELGAGWRAGAAVRLDEAPLQRFAGRTILDAVRLPAAPAGAADWARIPAVRLRSEGGRAAEVAGFEPTEVRAVLTPEALVLRVFCTEHRLDLMQPATEPANIWSSENVEVSVGPEGFAGLQVETGPNGLVQCLRLVLAGKSAKATDPLPGLSVVPEQAADGWAATFTLPLAALIASSGAPAGSRPENRPWTIQVTRFRPARAAVGDVEQASILAVTQSETMRCPARHALLRPVLPMADVAVAAPEPVPELPRPVLDAARRQALVPGQLLGRWIGARKKARHDDMQQTLAALQDAAAWKTFAAERRARLLKAVYAPDGKLPERTPLKPLSVYEHTGDGYVVEGIIYESRPGYPVPITVYRPAAGAAQARRPVLIMIPAWHAARNSQDLQIVGMNLARAGAMAVLFESMGSGERSVTALWEHKCYQRSLAGAQLLLAGEYISAWTAWDLSRGIDYLLARGDADPARIGLMGGVAGGGIESALAAAVDERIAVSIPFNATHASPLGAYFDPIHCVPDGHTLGLSWWLMSALIAPRALIQAQEFSWDDGAKASYAQFQRVYGLLGATNRLDFVHGGPNTHATHYNWMHRLPVYSILNRWWNLALPATRETEYTRTIPVGDLYCFSSEAGYRFQAENLPRLREAQAIATDLAKARRDGMRARRAGRPEALRQDLDALLGRTQPEAAAPETGAPGAWRGHPVERVWMNTETPPVAGAAVPGIALWVIAPKDAKPGKRPAVLGLAHAGKSQFLAACAEDVARLLEGGVTVALLDARGTGETSPGESQFPGGAAADLASELSMFSESLTAGQVKDARAALRYLAGRPDVDAGALGLWGEALAEPNGAADRPVLFDETGFRQCTPQPKNYLEPMGGTVALLAALYPIETANGAAVRPRGVLVRGALASYASVLDRRYHYLPIDAVIPRLLSVADLDEVAAALVADSVAVFGEDFRDGSNRSLAGDPWNLKPLPPQTTVVSGFLQALRGAGGSR